MASGTRLLVCSIGNPAPYLNTLHSAGHTVLNVLRESLSYPSFQKSRAHGNGLLSSGSYFTLWQSPSLMNVSGPAVSAAWKQFLRENKQMGYGEEGCGLVVVHDELELRVGEVKVRKGDASPKGHNGLKSIRDTLRGQMYTRIGVGIGRPESRDAGVVADYVLRKMSVEERRKISVSAGKVMEELMKLSEHSVKETKQGKAPLIQSNDKKFGREDAEAGSNFWLQGNGTFTGISSPVLEEAAESPSVSAHLL
ncbi:hypothetical protein CJF32_00000951 [Rutstroemia sp. NJR-2017a WRK4]|nr:hypothetical protein CJF32_00000951 [Rutstroemia sp. NJR-2017a WRK4]